MRLNRRTENPVPVMVIEVPPMVGPAAGVSDEMVGPGGA